MAHRPVCVMQTIRDAPTLSAALTAPEAMDSNLSCMGRGAPGALQEGQQARQQAPEHGSPFQLPRPHLPPHPSLPPPPEKAPSPLLGAHCVTRPRASPRQNAKPQAHLGTRALLLEAHAHMLAHTPARPRQNGKAQAHLGTRMLLGA
jgi:hypothetical protein